MSYVKVSSELLTSTIWREPDTIRILWVTMLVMANKWGEVMASVPGLADMARIPVEKAREGLDILLAPDPDSRTKEDEGRRLSVIQGGWLVLNYHYYRRKDSDEERKEKNAERQRRWYRRHKPNAKPDKPNASSRTLTPDIAKAEAEAEAKAEADVASVPKVQREPSVDGSAVPKVQREAIVGAARAQKRAFQPPELSELLVYAQAIGASEREARRCFDYYTSNGWKVGKNSMKDWRAAFRGWWSRVPKERPLY